MNFFGTLFLNKKVKIMTFRIVRYSNLWAIFYATKNVFDSLKVSNLPYGVLVSFNIRIIVDQNA